MAKLGSFRRSSSETVTHKAPEYKPWKPSVSVPINEDGSPIISTNIKDYIPKKAAEPVSSNLTPTATGLRFLGKNETTLTEKQVIQSRKPGFRTGDVYVPSKVETIRTTGAFTPVPGAITKIVMAYVEDGFRVTFAVDIDIDGRILRKYIVTTPADKALRLRETYAPKPFIAKVKEPGQTKVEEEPGRTRIGRGPKRI